MNTLLSLVADFNQQWRTLKQWEPVTETSGAMCLAYRKSLIEKGNELLSHPNDMLLCTHDYVIACERAQMLGCKKITSPISPDNKLQNILDFEVCKNIVDKAVSNNEESVILCPHYSINIASKYEDGEALQYDLDELSDYLGYYVEVSDYDDMIIYLVSSED